MNTPSAPVSPAAKLPPEEARLAIFEEGVATHALSRKLIDCSDGRRYQLFFAIPHDGSADAQARVLYMLDGNAAFDALTPELLSLVPGLTLVGIGYDTPLRFDRSARSLDYTPPRNENDPQPDPQRPERMVGGASLFVERLISELMPQAEAQLPYAVGGRAIWGHSLAGMCVLHTLFTQPGHFERYVAVSPSLWWEDKLLLKREADIAPDALGKAEILVMLGDSERRSSPEGPHWDGPAPHTLEMIRRLGERPGISITHTIFAGAGHAATLPASLKPALEFAAK